MVAMSRTVVPAIYLLAPNKCAATRKILPLGLSSRPPMRDGFLYADGSTFATNPTIYRLNVYLHCCKLTFLHEQNDTFRQSQTKHLLGMVVTRMVH